VTRADSDIPGRGVRSEVWTPVTSSEPRRGSEPAPGSEERSAPAVAVGKIRRRLAPGVLREARVNVRLAGAELDQVRQAAALARLTVTGYVAASAVAAAQESVVPGAQARTTQTGAAVAALNGLAAQVQRVGVNLNQLARYANTTGEVGAEVTAAAAAVTATLRRVDEATVHLVVGQP